MGIFAALVFNHLHKCTPKKFPPGRPKAPRPLHPRHCAPRRGAESCSPNFQSSLTYFRPATYAHTPRLSHPGLLDLVRHNEIESRHKGALQRCSTAEKRGRSPIGADAGPEGLYFQSRLRENPLQLESWWKTPVGPVILSPAVFTPRTGPPR